ncbi:DUF3854 domain-containing protein [Tolypothrix campylonemoides VB511288]|nr:DUF3854 domain-containing protein [Tolypothrix campylonemoides VB511288]
MSSCAEELCCKGDEESTSISSLPPAPQHPSTPAESTPDNSSCNSVLEPLHRTEWLNSAVDEEIVRLNVKSLSCYTPLEYLLYALPQNARRNDGRLRDSYLRKYSHTTKGGWWVSGLDPKNNWKSMDWGRFKPNDPRLEWDKETQKHTEKLVKYESPIKTPNRVTYLRVPLHIWKMVAERYNIPMPEQIVVTQSGEAIGFWAWVVAHPQIPIILTEGEKKAASLLTLGFVAIGLPGIWNGRVGKGELEKLHPDLVPVAQKGRKFIILFDFETKPKTKQDIYQATCRTGWAILRQNCFCEVALLPGQEKGVDDWIVALGKKANTALTALIDDSRTLSEYQQTFTWRRPIGLHKYKPNIIVNTRYLSNAIQKLPDAGLVCLLSDMGTGKTELLARYRKQHLDESFLNNGHRVNLLKNLAVRLETVMYNSVKNGNLGRANALSITVDSLYKLASNLQAYGCVFIDEACQYLAHLLKSKTCREHRGDILEVLETVVYRAKLVVLADAHLDDLTIDFFRQMRPKGEVPFIIQNDWKQGGREVYWYSGSNSSALVAQIHADILAGKRPMVVSDSKRFIKKLERTLLSVKWPALSADTDDDTPEPEEDRKLRVWAIHSENSGSEENIIFIKEINTAIKSVDALLTSPSLGTGVDISEKHFDVIFGAFHAVSQSATECAQQLWRNRPDVPMHVWVAERPPFGYAETNARKIKEKYLQKNEMTAFLIRIDRETGRRGAEKDWALETSCKIEAQRNWSINNLRADLRSLLESMGNTIIPRGSGLNESAKKLMKAAGKLIDWEHCEAVASALDIDRKTYEARLHQDYLKPKEIFECEKFRIRDAYGMDVTPELVEKDDGGQLMGKLIALEAILSSPGEVITDQEGREFPTPPLLIVERDRSERERLTICTDWANHSTTWLMRYKLGLREVLVALMQGQEFALSEEMVQTVVQRSYQLAPHIKQILNLTISPDAEGMWILGKYLEQLGLSTQWRRVGPRGHQVRHYTLNTEERDFAQKVLSYRQLKRESKERKRQLEREAAERRMAVRYKQYGIEPDTPDVVTSPPNIGGEQLEGGCDYRPEEAQNKSTNQPEQEEVLTPDWWQRVKNYTQAVMERLKFGVEAVKELLNGLSRDERWGVMVEWEDTNPYGFNKFAELMPDWVEFCNAGF